MRLFLGIPLPDDLLDVIEKYESNKEFKKFKITWIKRDNLHITLKFLGEVQGEKLNLIKINLSKALKGYQFFYLKPVDINAFPSDHNLRMISLNFEPLLQLSKIVNYIEIALEALGFSKEARLFRPHVTLSRLKDKIDKEKLLEIFKKNKFEFDKIRVDKIILYESILDKHGAKYCVVEEY